MGKIGENRIGFGIDIHRFDMDRRLKERENEKGENEKGESEINIKIGGVNVLHDKYVLAHSDGDFLIHAIVDALLGAMGKGDIGTHFPDTDEEWKGADSRVFLEKSMEMLRGIGGRVLNLDTTIICEKPKISPYFFEIRKSLGLMMGIDCERINIKGKTAEKLGFIGEGVGVGAVANILLAV